MINIILDTNFVIYCAKNKLDYVEELSNMINEDYEIIVPLQVINELERLRDDKYKKVSGKDKDACTLALKLIEFNKIKKVNAEGKTVDEAIIDLAKNNRNIVCTLDKEMRTILQRVILISRGKKLILTK